ncbi:hypothetical protein [Micromonospora sp. NPDC051006]|uniref:hypothetical protein n=1 Tax=Micromonospora sp. NPDC051006 TaxID=3364283 RepID=UPI0037BAA936
MRRQTAAMMQLPLLGLLAACTPPDEPVVALAVLDGRPIGVLVPCDGSFSQMSVYETSEDHTTDRSLTSWRIIGQSTTEVVEVPLLGQPPEGWETAGTREASPPASGTAARREPLTELKPDATYSLSGSSGRDAIPVDFSTADFARIGPDQMLAPVDHDTTKVVSRDAFVRVARKSCH